MVHIPKKGLGNLLSESANTFGGFAVVVEKRPSFSVKCLLRRQSTRDYEQHNAIPLIITGAFESSCEGLSEVYFRFAQLWQDPFFLFQSPQKSGHKCPHYKVTKCGLWSTGTYLRRTVC